MLAQLGANFAAVHSVACNIYQMRSGIAAGVALLAVSGVVSGCAVPISLSSRNQTTLVSGEVREIDEAAGKITLRHGPIESLDLEEEGATMDFRVKDLAMLKQVKVGDRVQFEAEHAPAELTITKLQRDR